MTELRGDIPGLLQRGSLVTLDPKIRDHYGGRSSAIVFVAGSVAATVTFLEDYRPLPIPLSELSLDLSDPTGRFHARLWLAERGHDVGNEDRAEVLAWSVLSVWRGGKPLKGIAPAWVPQSCGWWGRVAGLLEYALVGKNGGWATFPGRSYFPQHCPFRRDRGNTGGKEAADTALIADGWALTNDDGSLTLPPLPGAK